MDFDLLETKLNQLLHILTETEGWIDIPAETLGKDTKLVRACQRNLQLLVEYASDINVILILDLGNKAPKNYRESFSLVFDMKFASALSDAERKSLLSSVEWRNNLIHEYEPAESDETFYLKLREFLAAYRAYARLVYAHFGRKDKSAA